MTEIEGRAAFEPTTIRVMLVDDQDLVRVGLKMILESEDGIEIVAEARTGREAIERAAANDIDVICMDVQMPVMDGLEATRQLVERGVTAGILVLTTFDRDDYLFSALRAGASGFVLKNATPESLIEAVQVIARGDALLSPDVTRRVIERFSTAAEVGMPEAKTTEARTTEATVDVSSAAATTASRALGGQERTLGAESFDAKANGAEAHDPTVHDPTVHDQTGNQSVSSTETGVSSEAQARLAELTDREHQVLELLAQGRSNQEIAVELYVGEATVKTHVSKILMKLELRDRIQAVVFAYENGIAVPRT